MHPSAVPLENAARPMRRPADVSGGSVVPHDVLPGHETSRSRTARGVCFSGAGVGAGDRAGMRLS